jgi:hypothetical protein
MAESSGLFNLLRSESDRRESRTDLDAERRDEELVVNLIAGDRRQMAILRKVWRYAAASLDRSLAADGDTGSRLFSYVR